jgi:hypothetical protein
VNLELTVLDYDRIGGSDPIGKVTLGFNRKKLEKKHWVEMIENPRRPVIHWHVLQVQRLVSSTSGSFNYRGTRGEEVESTFSQSRKPGLRKSRCKL